MGQRAPAGCNNISSHPSICISHSAPSSEITLILALHVDKVPGKVQMAIKIRHVQFFSVNQDTVSQLKICDSNSVHASVWVDALHRPRGNRITQHTLGCT